MQPENNLQNAINDINIPVAPTENIMAQGTPNNKTEKTKMSKKQIVGLTILSLIAVGGVLFGVFGMNSQNEQIAQLKGQVSDANNKAAKLETGAEDTLGITNIEDEYSGDANRLNVIFSQSDFNTVQATMAPENVLAQAVEIEATDLLTNENVAVQTDDDTFVTMNFSVIDGKLKISNENGDEYIINQMENLRGILHFSNQYITVIDNNDNVYASPVGRPIVWRTEK